MKKLSIFFVFFIFFTFTFTSCHTKAEEIEISEDTYQLLMNLSNGWNLGNTLDANTDGTKENLGLTTETSWGMPYTTQEMIQAVAKKGFKSIRIPVSWHNHIVNGTTYQIDSQWMARVKTVVDWSLNAGLYVILNVHHDNMEVSDFFSNYGFVVTSNISTSDKAKSELYLRNVWNQIATTFKDYDNRLIFEVLNEPRARGESYEWWGSGTAISNSNKLIKEYERLCLTTIRATGSNNANRFVMIPTYAANAQLNEGWSMPNDTVENKLLLSAHAYTPSNFALGDSSVTKFDSSCTSQIDYIFNFLDDTYISKGIAVVMGEASCSDKNNLADREKWFKYYYNAAKNKGVPVILWDNMVVYPNSNDAGERHGYFNRNNLTWWHESLVNIAVTTK